MLPPITKDDHSKTATQSNCPKSNVNYHDPAGNISQPKVYRLDSRLWVMTLGQSSLDRRLEAGMSAGVRSVFKFVVVTG